MIIQSITFIADEGGKKSSSSVGSFAGGGEGESPGGFFWVLEMVRCLEYSLDWVLSSHKVGFSFGLAK